MILVYLIGVVFDNPVSHKEESISRVDTISQIFFDHETGHINCIQIKQALRQK